MEMDIGMFGGYRLIVVPARKQYSHKLSRIRRRGFTLAANIRRKRFIGWTNDLPDGQTIIDKNTNTIYMNQETKIALDLAIKKEQGS